MAGSQVLSPLEDLGYFVEWGGKSWERLVGYAIREFAGENLAGKRVLEIGARFGKMSSLFALLGAETTGADISRESLQIAEAEAAKWGVSERTRFVAYDGDLDVFEDASFDLVFTKSVLVVVPELESFLRKMSRKLRPGGKVVFLENARGSALVHALRAVRHRKWAAFRDARYFTRRELSIVREVFDVERIERAMLPPIYLILGRRR